MSVLPEGSVATVIRISFRSSASAPIPSVLRHHQTDREQSDHSFASQPGRQLLGHQVHLPAVLLACPFEGIEARSVARSTSSLPRCWNACPTWSSLAAYSFSSGCMESNRMVISPQARLTAAIRASSSRSRLSTTGLLILIRDMHAVITDDADPAGNRPHHVPGDALPVMPQRELLPLLAPGGQHGRPVTVDLGRAVAVRQAVDEGVPLILSSPTDEHARTPSLLGYVVKGLHRCPPIAPSS